MTDRTMKTTTPEQTFELGACLAAFLQPGDVLLLSGDLGAGKTQLTKGIAKGLGVGDPVTSPTFNILLVHEGRMPLYHLDLYRLETAEELEDIDYFATLEGDGVSVVEWGDRFPEAAPQDGLSVVIEIESATARSLHLMPLGTRGERLTEAWLRCAGQPGQNDGDDRR